MRKFDKIERLCVVLIVAMLIFLTLTACAGEEPHTMTVVCQPGSTVNIRSKPSQKAEIVGRLFLGDKITIDEIDSKGWVHSPDMLCEAGGGWINAGYVLAGDVEIMEDVVEAKVTAGGRVAARKSADGERRLWLKPGMVVHALAVGEDWTLTDVGFVQTKYLEVAR